VCQGQCRTVRHVECCESRTCDEGVCVSLCECVRVLLPLLCLVAFFSFPQWNRPSSNRHSRFVKPTHAMNHVMSCPVTSSSLRVKCCIHCGGIIASTMLLPLTVAAGTDPGVGVTWRWLQESGKVCDDWLGGVCGRGFDSRCGHCPVDSSHDAWVCMSPGRFPSPASERVRGEVGRETNRSQSQGTHDGM